MNELKKHHQERGTLSVRQLALRWGVGDLPLVAKVCDLAHTWVFDQAGRGTEEQASANEGAKK
jgi:hypothetical protein